MSYVSADDSPRVMPAERYNKLVQETSKAIASFNQLTRSIQQKMSLFGTPQDSRANHQQLTELTEKGNKMVTKINRRIQMLHKACQGLQARMRKTQMTKLSADFKVQVKQFEDTCSKLVASERQTINQIRRSSTSFRDDGDMGKVMANAGGVGGFANYNEDQIYAQANITRYSEDDLARREEDILHINHQLREVNAAFHEIDDLVQEQGEQIVEIEDNTEEARENVAGALDQVQKADARRKYCACGRMQKIMYGIIAIIAILLIIIVLQQQK